MIIKLAEVDDADKISLLIRKNAELVDANGYTALQRAAWSAQNKPNAIRQQITKRTVFCAFQERELIGTIALQDNLLCGMYASHTKRGLGIGLKLLKHLERHAREKGISELILTATPNGYGFYLKHGFLPYGITTLEYDGIKFPEIKMKKKLN